MTNTEMENKIRAILPRAQFEQDNFGQIVIYTDLIEEGGTLIPFDLEKAEAMYNTEMDEMASPKII